MPNETNPADVRSLIAPADLRTLDRMGRGHMVPVIDYGDCWECETTRGEGFTVPADVQYIPAQIGGVETADGATFSVEDEGDDSATLPQSVARSLADYMPEGCSGEVRSATIRRGVYLCRMSAPGYLDCTDWEAHDTAQSAADSLIESYALEDEAEDTDTE